MENKIVVRVYVYYNFILNTRTPRRDVVYDGQCKVDLGTNKMDVKMDLEVA